MWDFLTGSRRGRKGGKSKDRAYSPLAASPEASPNRIPGQDVDEEGVDDEGEEDEEEQFSPRGRPNPATTYFTHRHVDVDEDEVEDEEGEDGGAVDTPLLPIFSAALLDRLPLYNITHAIRLLVIQKCETTLSWEQLRTPQISQFVVKPVQSQIRTNHFNRATLCALIANCLQFQKESQLLPGNAGVSRTRALICELLAMRLVKEFTTRELIDALSYDFDPLQGISAPSTGMNTPGQATPAIQDVQASRVQARGARVSTIEIAIRAQAKRFLAHPLVVQHLEAIWAGTVVFHFEADSLHRKPTPRQDDEPGRATLGYGTLNPHSPSALPADSVLSRKAHALQVAQKAVDEPSSVRRSATLYDPREASLFKLSRLRVPRYRQVFSTLSFAIMLGLFLAVLVQRSLNITPLEVVFWVWSAGYMLDEVVGFTEQGFGLYILSFWNAFDLGILCLFICYYCLRIYGVVIAEQGRHRIASMAYDVLASTAVLLFPRLFSVLDHYRYFSQLLIAFRLMAQDLMAVLILILISYSGFFVAFTLSFSDDNTDGSAVAYALFQILMGFTPAAWEKWPGYNALGKGIMAAFLIICHFLIVTILITVLTNSFMAIVKNADEEHQFLFAVNTISMVKSDALFSYVAPTNVLGWLLSPLRYLIPFRQYLKVNRTVIKITHFPVLLVIFAYERAVLSGYSYEPIDLIERPARFQTKALAFSFNRAPEPFSPGNRLREPSVISFHKDRALDEVFRRPFRGSTMNTTTRLGPERRGSSNVVDTWMQEAENEGGASPPLEQPRSVLERLEHHRPSLRRAATADKFRNKRNREFSTATKSLGSDPESRSFTARRPQPIEEEAEPAEMSTETVPEETDADGDDENNGESDQATPAIGESAVSVVGKENATPGAEESESEYYHTPTASKSPYMQMSAAAKDRLQDSVDLLHAGNNAYSAQVSAQRKMHGRNTSSGTVLFAPLVDDPSATHPVRQSRPTTAKQPNSGGTSTPNARKTLASGQQTPKSKAATRARPIMPPRQRTAPMATRAGISFLDIAQQSRRNPSFNARALDLASEIGDNNWGPSGGIDAGGLSGMPASFSEQLLRERDMQRERDREREEQRRQTEDQEKGMVNRIMLSRMHTLEEGFREVLKEIKDMSHHASSSRRESEGDVVVRTAKPRAVRVDTASSSQGRGAAGVAPLTPLGRLSVAGGGEGKVRKSPRKLQRRNTKGKGIEGPASSSRIGEREAPSPESVLSVVQPREGEAKAGNPDERPSTAVRTPEPPKREE
ncbi:hypothetical protein B0A54_11357 [Friedmanniomyces endolithicus]|uniref:Ion transport domain-containing protein n=1 Tax=Friedmanniomyces endolithicus TaxID=329885 RepID=A0A4U0UMN6_9PEZI|nr:hypothetical protein LTS09_011698 [Friedmanniomyces endolithicus]TKA36993.1 hypothetical protein B0A54_11357 [Friedmanniomyces endolithicus]